MSILTLRRSRLRPATLAVCLCMTLIAGGARAQSQTFNFDLPPEPLSQALRDYAHISGQQIIFTDDLVAGRQAPALHGAFTADDALGRLLTGTDLVVEHAPSGALMVRRKEAALEERPAGQAAGGKDADREEIVVTGTNIRGAPPVGANVDVISRQEIQNSGYTQLQDIINQRSEFVRSEASETGVSPQATDGLLLNSNSGTALSLRNLGADSTLVLVNGLRLPGAGVNGAFVDVSTIPAAAVERVEILPDGASAIYGSDAVGGVVNFIFRKDYDGAQSSVRYTDYAGGVPEAVASQLFGKNWNGGNILIGYQYDYRENLPNTKRAYIREDLQPLGGTDSRVFQCNPGNFLNPKTGLPAFGIPGNQNGHGLTVATALQTSPNFCDAYFDVFPQRTSHDVFAVISQDVGDRFHFFSNIRYSDHAAKSVLQAFRTTVTVPSSNPFYVNPFGGTAPTRIAYQFTNELGPEINDATTRTFLGSGGVDAELWGDWTADLTASFAQQDDKSLVTNLVNARSLALAAADTNPATAFNPFGDGTANNPATIASIKDFQRQEGLSSELDIRALTSGSLFELPAGPVRLALGTEYLKSQTHAIFAVTRTGVPAYDLHLGRHDTSYFAELRAPLVSDAMNIPLVHSLDVSGAIRRDNYSDFGSTTNGKVGLSWSPVSAVKLRGTWSTSFKAPRLIQLASAREFFLPLTLVDPSSPTGKTNTLVEYGANPELKPETATVFTIGGDVSLPGELTASATYFNIDYNNRIAPAGPTGNPFAVLQFPTQWASVITRNPSAQQISTFCSSPLLVGSCPGPTTIGAIADLRLLNLARVQVQGLDLSLKKSFLFGADKVDLGLAGTYNFQVGQQVTATLPEVELVGTYANLPDFKGTLTAAWSRGPWRASAALNYLSSSHDPSSTKHPSIAAWVTLDVGVEYRFEAASGLLRGVELRANIVNIADQSPPFADVSAFGYDPTNANPYGRIVSVQLTKNW